MAFPWLALAGAATSAVGSIFSAKGEQQNNNAMVDFRNRQRMRDYNDRLKIRQHNILTTNNIYRQKVSQYEQTIRAIDKGLNDTFLNEQARMNEEFRAAAFNQQTSSIAQAQSQGKRAARNVSGNTAARGSALDAAKYGRAEEVLKQSLRSKMFAATRRNEMAVREANNAQDKAFAGVAFAPTFAPAPSAPELIPYNTRAQNTNMLGTVLGAAGGLATAIGGMDFGGGGGGGSNPGDALKIGKTDWGSMNNSFGNIGYSPSFNPGNFNFSNPFGG